MSRSSFRQSALNWSIALGTWESSPCPSQDHSFQGITWLLREQDADMGPSPMQNLGLLADNGAYANLAYLLSDDCANQVSLDMYEACGEEVYQYHLAPEGCLLSQADEVLRYVHDNAGPGLPPEAAELALGLSLCQRNFAFGAQTEVRLFRDRLEVESLGTPLDPAGLTVLRNPNLAALLRRLRLPAGALPRFADLQARYRDLPGTPELHLLPNSTLLRLPL